MSASVVITALVNFITFLASIPLVGAGIWLSTKHGTECVKFLDWPIILIGLIILLISLAGFIGACYRITWLLWIYLFVMFLVILLLLAFIIFALVVTKDGPTTGRNFQIQDYSRWLQYELKDSNNWNKIKSCITDSNTCSDLNGKYTTYAAYYKADLSPVQAGCCSPPSVCGYQFENPTDWLKPSTSVSAEADCTRWSNSQAQLCYSCDSCKGGVAAQVKKGWRKVVVLTVVVFIVLIVLYIIGLCAFRNAQTHKMFKRHADTYRSRTWRRRNWFRNY